MKRIDLKFKIIGKKKEEIKKIVLLQKENNFILNLGSEKFIDIHNIGRFLLEIEKYIFSFYEGHKKILRKEKLKLEEVKIPLITKLNKEKKEKLSIILSDFFLFLYKIKVQFSFYETSIEMGEKEVSEKNYDSILLFSGGLDSIIGTSYCEEKFKKTLLVCTDQKPKLRYLLNEMEKKLTKFDMIKIRGHRMPSGFFSNTAGLSYILNGSIYAFLHNSPIIISECGVTSYQPRFGPLNDITYTTHPYTINLAKEIFRIVFDKDLVVDLPFNNNTKSEMIAMYSNPERIRMSHSCLTTNSFSRGKIPKNCGRCYACIIRRLAINPIMDDPTEYKNKINWDKKELFHPILDFCYFTLKNYSLLDYPQKEKIEKYNKKDMYKRFAIDTLLSIRESSRKEEVPGHILDYVIDFDKHMLDERLKRIKLLTAPKINKEH